MRTLTAKEQRFVEEYHHDCNATRAATAAGYSKRNAKQIGHQLVHRPVIAAAIAELERSRTVGFDARKLRQLTGEGFVYAVQGVEGGLVKVGKGIHPPRRLAAFQVGSPVVLRILRQVSCCNMNVAEKALHAHFAHARKHGEWFALTQRDLREMEGVVIAAIHGCDGARVLACYCAPGAGATLNETLLEKSAPIRLVTARRGPKRRARAVVQRGQIPLRLSSAS